MEVSVTCCLFCFGCGTGIHFMDWEVRDIFTLRNLVQKSRVSVILITTTCCTWLFDLKKEVKNRCDERTFSQGQFGWNSLNIHANPSQIRRFVHWIGRHRRWIVFFFLLDVNRWEDRSRGIHQKCLSISQLRLRAEETPKFRFQVSRFYYWKIECELQRKSSFDNILNSWGHREELTAYGPAKQPSLNHTTLLGFPLFKSQFQFLEAFFCQPQNWHHDPFTFFQFTMKNT